MKREIAMPIRPIPFNIISGTETEKITAPVVRRFIADLALF